MKAMLLAAGFGTRLRPITDSLPKCMVRVAGKPVLQWNIEFLRSQGIVDLVINLHRHPQAVVDYFQDGASLGVRLNYSYEPELMGTAGAVWAARRFFLQDRFIVLYADNLINCNLKALLSLHLNNNSALTMALFRRQDVSTSGVVQLNDQGKIVAFEEKPGKDEMLSHWVNAGLFLCEASLLLQYITPGRPSDFGYDVLPALLRAGESLYGYTMGPAESLHWIDTHQDLAYTKKFFTLNNLQ